MSTNGFVVVGGHLGLGMLIREETHAETVSPCEKKLLGHHKEPPPPTFHL